MENAGPDELQARIKVAGRNINTLRDADDIALMAESEEELKNLLMRVKEESEKASFKVNIKKKKKIWSHHFWKKKTEAVTDFLFLCSKITVDGDCSREIRRQFLLGRKVMTNLGSVLKSKDIALLTKVHIIKAMVFPVVMCGCENWIIKKAEC